MTHVTAGLFHKLSIKFRLFALCALMLAGIAAMAGLGYGWTHAETTRAAAFISEDFASVAALGTARASLANVRRYEKDTFLNLADEADLKKYQVQWRNELAALAAALDRLEAIGIAGHKEAISTIRRGLTGYRAGVEGIVKEIESGKINDPWAANKSVDKFKAEVRSADKALEELAKQIDAASETKRTEIHESAKRAGVWITAAAIVCLSIALLLSFLNVRSITKPLDELKDVAEVISSGDLTKAVSNNRGDELGALSQSMLKMQTWLNDVVTEVKSASQSVASASSEIAQGNTDLSSRTENQAANLQETAATIEELTATVKQSASTAQRASALALEATKAAEDGGQRVEGVIQTMTEIQSSSRKISEIISVIDSIAFQTNILALNAAVEAARAGEQGRGFNVVAGEVRMLAQRCAEAAREIKDLINESVEKVDSGSARVLAAGETMGAIVESVKRVSELVQEISTTSTEQSGGIDQASLAISHLDQMTQQNAALVEQSAAAAVSLDHQAQKLNSLVSVFRLRPATL